MESIFSTLTAENVAQLSRDQFERAWLLYQIPANATIHTPVPGKMLPEKIGMPGDFFIEAISRRLAVMTPDVEYSPVTVLLLASIAPNIAAVMMLAYSLYRETQVRGPISLADMCNLIIPDGGPTEEHYHSWWMRQKQTGINDNQIDTRAFWA